MINWKENFYKIIKGEKPEIIPFIPRFDLWYKVNSNKEIKPEILTDINSQIDFYRKLGFIPYSNIPDFSAGGDLTRTIHRALGFYNLPQIPFKINYNKTKVNYHFNNSTTFVEYITPVGSVDCEFVFTEEMKKSGATISWINKRIIKSKDDYKILEYIFEDMTIEDNYDEFNKFIKEQGGEYIPIATGLLAVSGMQHIMRDFLNVTEFFLHFVDYKNYLLNLAKKIDNKLSEIVNILTKCSAEIILIGANFDSTITFPPFYKSHILPQFQDISKKLHKCAKKIISHCDGENIDLWDLYLKSGIDILEAVAVKPMVKQSLEEILDIMNNKAVIWGLINSISLLNSSLNEKDFRKYIDKLIAFSKDNKVILGISDTAPIDMNINRILYIRDMVLKP